MTMPSDQPRRACAVCARGLHRLVDTHTGEYQYVHPFDMELAETDDHPPVPVAPNEIKMDTRCDFCFWRDPQWVIPVRDFSYNWAKLGMPIGGSSVGSWAACDTCADLVNRGLWPNLVRRAADAYLHTTRELELDSAMHNDEASEFAIEHIRATYKKLRKNILGSPRRVE